jgi:pimeloyl-ACP methyl ester carboxylesterase
MAPGTGEPDVQSMNPARSDTLTVPGASLYYEVRGAGPVLLMIPGGPADAGAFAGIAGLLADRYTVVAYDPRGNSRSSLDGPPEDWRADVQSDDASRLLAAVGTAPAYVLGSSGGAQIGLDLAACHPEQVHTLVAHEPPAVELLPDAAHQRAFFQAVYDTYRSDGVGPAMQEFLVGAGLVGAGVGLLEGGPASAGAGPRSGPTPEMAEMQARMGRNLDLFLAHGVRQISGYRPDIGALTAGSTRIVVGVGEASREQLAHRAGVALAERLGTNAVHFPGDHAGYGTHPAAFAETLHNVLTGS